MSGLRGYDAWLTRDPWSDMPDIPMPGDPFYPTCACGAFLRREPDMTPALSAFGRYAKPVPWVTWHVDMAHCDGQTNGDFETGCDTPTHKVHEPHDYEIWATGIHHHTCRRCGRINKVVAG